MCSYLQDLHESLNEYFPNHPCMMSHACVKSPFRVQDRPVGLDVIKQEMFINRASDSMGQITFKEAPRVKSGDGIKGERPQSSAKFSVFLLSLSTAHQCDCQIFFICLGQNIHLNRWVQCLRPVEPRLPSSWLAQSSRKLLRLVKHSTFRWQFDHTAVLGSKFAIHPKHRSLPGW